MAVVATETVVGSHVLTIDAYTKTTAALAVGESIQSERFRVGGHDWYIKCYPRGDNDQAADWVSVFLCLDLDHGHGVSLSHELKPSYTFVLLDHAGEEILSDPPWPGETTIVHSTADGFPIEWGTSEFIRRKALESYMIVQGDDCCRIRCDVTLTREPPSPSGLGDLLLATEVGRDVTFVVGGEQFTAHSCVLAARSSPAFMEEVLGSTATGKESAADVVVRVDGVQPRVFEALLHFIYTDSLADDDGGGYRIAVVQGLLAAADRYGMERLMLVCCDVLAGSEAGRDVTFVVRGELFTAHRCVLAARSSPAFLAKVVGKGKESGGSLHVQVDGISLRAFIALLHYIYADCVPDHGVAQDLLAEAEWYGMERLKMICIDVLCNNIDETTALRTLQLAHKHGCLKLKQACVKYIRGKLDAVTLEESK